jgi:hydrogenase nickel incorporation protein HypA/HybF
MHELSIAGAIVDAATRHGGGRRVEKVEVKVGQLRQVVPSALEFAFALVAEGTPVEGAVLEIEHVHARGACRRCGTEQDLEGFPLGCPGCGSLDVDLVAGEELSIDALELADEPEAVRRRQDGEAGGSGLRGDPARAATSGSR